MNESAREPAARKIARLRYSFFQQIPERLKEINDLWTRLRENPADEGNLVELHRILHGLKGTGRSFGFADLGNTAAAAETLLNAKPAETIQYPSWSEEMERQFLALRRVASAMTEPDVAEQGRADSFDEQAEFRAGVKDTSQKKVFICDDDVLLAEQLSIQIACFGYDTAFFATTDSLRTALPDHRPDVLIMDIHFPEGRVAGTELIRSLKRDNDFPQPVIFLSGRSDFEARLSAVLAGGSAYFVKPAGIHDLVMVLDMLTGRQQPEPYRILLVDDDPMMSDYHGLILREAGMEARSVVNPADVLNVLQEFRPDLVLMDMYMQGCSGRDLAKVIRQVPEYLAMPIIYLSGESDRKKQISALRIGAEDFMIKPVVPSELVAAVEMRAERMRSLHSMMVRDSLTGLFNHTTTTQLLVKALVEARRRNASLCFVMLDIDHFKKVNDTYGHPVGDQVILALSRILKQRLRASDVVGRYGGEEFALILTDITPEKAVTLVEELLTDFARLRFNGKDETFACTFSAGIADFPGYENLESLREAADQALYRAKNNGRNQVAVSLEAKNHE
ncbi:MAG: diguanylate cyclase [Syntrophaceae bacterium]|nr:diguanylate cyclase [Syntrophaceae bacterium]